jgi:light-regulated signal transduction histidine kinase (bacteriophytochrome)
MISGMLYQEVKRYSETLEKSNAQLENFAYNISHDLQNHISIMISSLRVIDKKYIDEKNPDAKKLMNIAIDKIFQMSQLTNDLLSYSRIGKNKKGFALISLEEVLNEAITNLTDKIKSKNAKITYGKLPTIYGNKVLLLNVFQNIIDNSIKYSSNEREPEIKISSKENESEWILSFSDNGMGIKPEHQDKVFDMFYRIDEIKSKIEGTGIGLASCKRIIDLHNGRMWLESEYSKGSTFYISLPKNQLPPKDF